jgi:hypothetical protein
MDRRSYPARPANLERNGLTLRLVYAAEAGADVRLGRRDLRLPRLSEKLTGIAETSRRDRVLGALNKAACYGIVGIECCGLRQ